MSRVQLPSVTPFIHLVFSSLGLILPAYARWMFTADGSGPVGLFHDFNAKVALSNAGREPHPSLRLLRTRARPDIQRLVLEDPGLRRRPIDVRLARARTGQRRLRLQR